MKTIALLLASLTFLMPQGRGADIEENVVSPQRKFACQIYSRGEQGGRYVDLVELARPEHHRRLFESVRGLEIKWSPDDHWLAVLDHEGGDNVTVTIIAIQENQLKPEAWRTEVVYQSPWPTRANTYWDVAKWNLKMGAVTLLCRYKLPYSDEWVKKHVEVMVDYR